MAESRFSRTELLLGQDSIRKLLEKRVAVFGIGGVGGYVTEALARSGVGALDLIDKDTVSISNINRQIIALTSTVGKYKTEVMKERILDELKRSFRPEFLNRIDDIIVFHKLDESNVEDIARLMLKSVAKRLHERDIELTYTEDAIQHLAKKGFDPVYGARPLRRLIMQTVEDQLSEEILEGHIQFGDQVEMYLEDDKICFRTVQ